MAIRQAVAPLIRGYDFGIGVDLMSGSPLAQVVVNNHSSIDGAEGSIVAYQVRRIRTTAELEQSLGINVEASYGSAMFGAGIAARFAFTQQSKIQASTLFMAVTALVQLKFLSIDEPVLTARAAAQVDRPDIFDQRFGNMFVRGISRGGLFLGVLRVETERVEDSESISADLEGSYGLFSAEASTKFEQIQKRFRASTFVNMYHEGGPTNLKIEDHTNPIELLRNVNLFLDSFQRTPEQVAIPYEVTLAPIIIADGPLPPNAADMEHAQDVLVFCAKRRSTLLDQLNLLQYTVDNASRFDFASGASIQAVRDAGVGTQADLDLIARCASAAINHPGSAKFPVDFAHEEQKAFPSAVMPDPMPRPKVGQLGVWTPKEPMPTARDGLGLAVADGKIYAIGGHLGKAPPNRADAVEEYDPVSNNWTTRRSMPTPRSGLGLAVTANGKIYAIGGFASNGSAGAVEEYDPQTDSWMAKTPLSAGRADLAVIMAGNGRIYAVGGHGGPGPTPLAQTIMEEYDPAADKWTTKRPMPTGRRSLGLALASNGKLYAIGGNDNGPLVTVEEYEPATDIWTAKMPMPTARWGIALVAAKNGKLYAIGGASRNGIVAIVEEYDPTTDAWSTIKAPMLTARTALAGAVVQNGKIYAAGGRFAGLATDVCPTLEEFIP